MFARRLAELRNAKGLTQQEIADLLNVSRAAYAQWETGRRTPEADTLVRLADFFGVTTDYLYGRDEATELTDPEWVELFEQVRIKGMELEATALLRNATRLNKDKLRDLLKIFSLIEEEENDNKG